MKKKKYKRKYLVNGRYQFSQAAVTIIANLSVALLITALLSWFYLLAWNGIVIYNHNKMIPVYLICIVVLVISFSLLWSLYRSRAIAGMIKKIDSTLTDASNGVFADEPLKFRKGDYFASLSVSLNRCLALLQEKESSAESEVFAMQTLVSGIDSEDMNSKDVRNQLNVIIKRLKERQTNLF